MKVLMKGFAVTVLIAVVATGAQASLPNASGGPAIPAMKWLQTYAMSANAYGYVPHSSGHFPVLWLYGPKGQAKAYFSKKDVDVMRSLMAGFPKSLAARKPLEREPSLPAMEKLLQRLGRTVKAHAGADYTAVLYVMNKPCSVCRAFESALHKASTSHPGKLNIVTIRIKLPKHTGSKNLQRGS